MIKQESCPVIFCRLTNWSVNCFSSYYNVDRYTTPHTALIQALRARCSALFAFWWHYVSAANRWHENKQIIARHCWRVSFRCLRPPFKPKVSWCLWFSRFEWLGHWLGHACGFSVPGCITWPHNTNPCHRCRKRLQCGTGSRGQMAHLHINVWTVCHAVMFWYCVSSIWGWPSSKDLY